MTNLNSDNCLRTLYARADALHARSKTAETHVSNKAATLVSVAFSFLGGKFKCNNWEYTNWKLAPAPVNPSENNFEFEFRV